VNIFLCWSGRGIFIAKALKSWLEDVFEKNVNVLVSEEIDKGSVWFEALSGMLEEADCGLVCLTPEALTSPWIPYEAGALAKAVARKLGPGGQQSVGLRAFTFLSGVAPAEVKGPLSAFQSTIATDRGDVRRLVETLAQWVDWGAANGADWKRRLDERWDFSWGQLTRAFDLLPRTLPIEVFPELDHLFRRKTFEEPLRECVSQNWLGRYDGARETWAALKARQPAIEAACSRFAVDVYRALIAAVDSYAQSMSVLVGRGRFPVSVEGLLEIDPPGLALAAERVRDQVLTLVTYLVEPSQAPVFPESFRFQTGTPAQQRALIEARAAEVQRYGRLGQSPNLQFHGDEDRIFCPERGLGFDALMIQRYSDNPAHWFDSTPRSSEADGWDTSRWDLDRILYRVMLTGLQRKPASEWAKDAIEWQRNRYLSSLSSELDRSRALMRTSGATVPTVPLALHHALQMFRDFASDVIWPDPTNALRFLTDLEQTFPPGDDGGRLLTGLLEEIRAIVAQKKVSLAELRTPS
jgi:hypothetical protein